jgi:hypothetical protein
MKKLLMTILLASAICSAQELVFTNQTITVRSDQLSVESVEYRAQVVATNHVLTWVDAVQVTTNGMFDGYTVETNTVSQQIDTEVVTTNAATWLCHVIFELPKGHAWSLNGFPVSIERFRTRLEIPVSPDVVRETFGPASAGLEFAASNGAYTPQGQVKDAFLYFSAAALQAGINGASE